jgi:hypothetical protein
METSQLGITAPDASFTVPERFAPATCACAGKAMKKLNAKAANIKRWDAVLFRPIQEFISVISSLVWYTPFFFKRAVPYAKPLVEQPLEK